MFTNSSATLEVTTVKPSSSFLQKNISRTNALGFFLTYTAQIYEKIMQRVAPKLSQVINQGKPSITYVEIFMMIFF